MKTEVPQYEGCESIQKLMGSYISSELSSEDAHSVAEHLGVCPRCQELLNLQIDLKRSLQRAVRNSEAAGDQLRARVKSQIRRTESAAKPWSGWRPLMAIAATVLVVFSAAWLTRSNSSEPWRTSVAGQESYIESLFSEATAAIRVGLGAHVHCAHFREFATNVPTPAQVLEKLGPLYAGLMPIVREKVPRRYDLVLAHRCSYRGRPYVHLAFRGDGKLLSLVLTPKEGDESFARDGLVPVLSQSAIPLYRAGFEDFEVAGFETPGHLVYLVSNLDAEDNLELTVALAAATGDYVEAVKDELDTKPRG